MTDVTDVTEAGLKFIREIDEFCGFDRKWLVKLEGENTDPKYGWLPRERPIEKYIEYGVINLDKPPGPTSHEIVAWIKRMFNIERAGHGGTLEPRGGAGIPPRDRRPASGFAAYDTRHRQCGPLY